MFFVNAFFVENLCKMWKIDFVIMFHVKQKTLKKTPSQNNKTLCPASLFHVKQIQVLGTSKFSAFSTIVENLCKMWKVSFFVIMFHVKHCSFQK